MRLNKLKGIAHDLAHHLNFEMWFGSLKDMPKKVDSDVLELNGVFDKRCVQFFKKRLPKTFDFKRIQRIKVKIDRTMTSIKINIKLKVDDKEFSYQSGSRMG